MLSVLNIIWNKNSSILSCWVQRLLHCPYLVIIALCAASHYHYSDITWAPWYLSTSATRRLVQQFVQATPKLCTTGRCEGNLPVHDDVIKWKHFPRYWPFVRGIHRSPVNSPHKGQWRGALMFCLIRAWINSWVNDCEAGDLRRYLAHCDVIVM